MASVPASWGINLRLVASLGGRWDLDGNGWPGVLELTQQADGRLDGVMDGVMDGERVRGHHAPGERTAVLLRGPEGRPTQAFVSSTETVWVRFAGSEPAQLYVAGNSSMRSEQVFGQRVAGYLSGKVYLLSSAAGATPTQMTHTVGATICWFCQP